MPRSLFDKFSQLLETDIQEKAAFNFLCSGIYYTDVQHLFHVHKSALSKLIPQVCQQIYSQLIEEHLKAILLFFTSTLILSCETEISQERIYLFILNTIIEKRYDSPVRRQYILIESF